MDKGDVPAGTTYQFLWLCVKHNKRDKVSILPLPTLNTTHIQYTVSLTPQSQPPNWIDIAAKCNTTHGAASKRYSRMKKAFEEGVATPTSSPVKTTPSEKKNNILAATSDTPTKRKRRPAKKASSDAVDEAKFEPEVDAEDGEVLDEVHVKPKRARLAKPKPKTKAKGKATIPEPMSESEIEDEDTFFDAVEEKDGKDERRSSSPFHSFF
jgi:hypothetical protein